jgi:hypothetical protein
MKTTAAVTVVGLALAAATAGAQEPSAEPERQEPVRTIRVLHNPYDIASFYRSSSGPAGFGYEVAPAGPYAIAGYYRNRQGRNAWAPFGFDRRWSRGGPGFSIGLRTRIGDRSELFLFAPTFLAPIGPLAGAFFLGR